MTDLMNQPHGEIDNWVLLIEPGWQQAHPDEQPPPEAMVGGWLLDRDGNKGPFQPNPEFVPPNGTTPTDPTDAVLRRIAQGAAGMDDLITSLRDGVVEIALTADDEPIVVVSPDDVRCVLVVTAPAHRRQLESERWAAVTGDALADVVPAGLDILLNPAGPAGFRLVTATLRAD